MGAETTPCKPERRELETIAVVERARCSHQPWKFRMAMHAEHARGYSNIEKSLEVLRAAARYPIIIT